MDICDSAFSMANRGCVLADVASEANIQRGEPIVQMTTHRRVLLAAAAIAVVGMLLPTNGFAHDQADLEVTITNVATNTTLQLPDGSTTGAPIAPGMYALVTDGVALFIDGKPVGNSGLEQLAEDGNFEPLLAHINALPGIRQAGMFIPGQPFELTARPGERLLFATMFVQSNDLFFAPAPAGLALFDASNRPIIGDRSTDVRLWDAGTEINEQPGTGRNQAPRQSAVNTGPAENGITHAVNDGFAYPAVGQVINLTIAAK